MRLRGERRADLQTALLCWVFSSTQGGKSKLLDFLRILDPESWPEDAGDDEALKRLMQAEAEYVCTLKPPERPSPAPPAAPPGTPGASGSG